MPFLDWSISQQVLICIITQFLKIRFIKHRWEREVQKLKMFKELMAKVLMTLIKNSALLMNYSTRWKWQISKLIQTNLKVIKKQVRSKQLQKIQNRRDKIRKVSTRYRVWCQSMIMLKIIWSGSTALNTPKLKRMKRQPKLIKLNKKSLKERDKKKTKRIRKMKRNDKPTSQTFKKKKRQDTIKSLFKNWQPSTSSPSLRQMEEEFSLRIRPILPPDSFWAKLRRSEELPKPNG